MNEERINYYEPVVVTVQKILTQHWQKSGESSCICGAALNSGYSIIDHQVDVLSNASVLAPRSPRVFFPGDIIPANVQVMDERGRVHPGAGHSTAWEHDGKHPSVGIRPLVEVCVNYWREVEKARQTREV